MIAKVLLSAWLLGVGYYAFVQRELSHVLRWPLYAAVAVGAVLVWFPDVSTSLALAIGIGRGADLMLYLWILVTFAVLLNLHVKLARIHILITDLARAFAVRQPLMPGSEAAEARLPRGSDDTT